MLVAGWLGTVGPAHALAQEARTLPLSLTWVAPASCPSAAAVERHARSAVQVPEGTTLPTVHAHIVVEETERGFVMRMDTTRDGELGSREVAGTDCVALAQAATLILALTFGAGVDLSATLEEPPGESGDVGEPGAEVDAPEPRGELVDVAPAVTPAEPGTAPDATTGTDAGETTSQTPDGERSLRVEGQLGLALQVGMLPRAALGVTGGVGLGTARVMAWAALTWLPRVQQGVPDVSVDQRYRAFLVELALGRPFDLGRVAIAPFGRLRVGTIRGESLGAAQDGHSRAAYVAPGVGLTLTLPARGRVRAALSLGLDVPVLRSRFTLGNVGVVHRVEAWGLGVDATLRLAR